MMSEADDERSFLIDESLAFRFGILEGNSTCAWRDLSGDDGDLWEFVSSTVSLSQSMIELTSRMSQAPRTNSSN